MTRWLSLPAFVLAALPIVLAWWLAGRPVAIVEGAGEAIPCLSYTPFRGNQTPFDAALSVAPSQIADDLRKLAAANIRCVRTYSVDQGLENVPEIAARHGTAVLLGAWIGRESSKNRSQLETAVRLANDYPKTVKAVIVGNEVLLRRERDSEDIANDLAWARARTAVPLTYADVWEFWLRNPSLAASVDFVTIHILPYWEDEPVANANAARYVIETWLRIRAAFQGQEVFLGETGWPSAGRMREGARPGRVEQARMLREFSRLALAEPELRYNLIEAFDQPWKRVAEGTVGGHWGIFDQFRLAKFPWEGPVAAEPQWRARLAASWILALALFAAAIGRSLSFGRALALAACAHGSAAALVLQADFVWASSRNALEWAIGASGLGLALLAAALFVRAFANPTAIPPATASVEAALAWLAAPARARLDAQLVLGIARVAFVAGALVQTLGLLFDGRYRGFPVAGFIVPAVLFAYLAGLGGSGRTADPQGRALALVLAAGGIAVGVIEGWANHQALLWTLTVLLLALPWLWPRREP